MPDRLWCQQWIKAHDSNIRRKVVRPHILDDDIKNNAELFERALYSGKEIEITEEVSKVLADAKVAKPWERVGDVDSALLGRILSNLELATLLSTSARGLAQS